MKLFKKKKKQVVSREAEPDVYHVPNEDERMNWGIEKAKLTLHYFEECLKSPKENQQYFSIKVMIEDGQHIEHIWLNEPSFDTDNNLFGIVGNKPINVKNVKEGQKIGIEKEKVSDWMIIENGRLIGGYTIRAIREGLKPSEWEGFDKSVGLFIDEGEDYFMPNSSTPEGAILQLEAAYDANDIDKAIDCKDFEKEAELMLCSTLENIEPDEQMIEKTAEILRLSFIKYFEENGMPNFAGVKRAFPVRQKISEEIYLITEVCYQPDGKKTMQKLNTFKTENGWKVLNLVE